MGKTKKRKLRFKIASKRYEYKKLLTKRSEAWFKLERSLSWSERDSLEEERRQLSMASTRGELTTLLLHPKKELREVAQVRYKEISCLEEIADLRKQIEEGKLARS